MVIDSTNYLKVIEDFPKQCRDALALPKGITVSGEISNIVVCGMGGSAIGGDLLKAYLSDTKIPVFVVRDYSLPNFVDEYSLVFAVSYSGNTEETLSAYSDAVRRNAKIVAITSGGRLAAECEKVIIIPSGYQPRAALGYLFLPMLGVLHNSGMIDIKNSDLNEMLSVLQRKEEFRQNAEELAKKIGERTPVVYSSALFEPVAYRWKTQFNENSKMPAFHHTYPEMNHNEINAFQSMRRENFIIIHIKDEQDNVRVKKRMQVCKSLMEEKVNVEEVTTKGSSFIARMFSAIYLGDLTSYYLALRNRVDPAPVGVIERLKQAIR